MHKPNGKMHGQFYAQVPSQIIGWGETEPGRKRWQIKENKKRKTKIGI